jgi:hypothetical protein
VAQQAHFALQKKFTLGAAKAFVAIAALSLILSGCAKQLWDPDTDANAVACRSTYGFPSGTPEYDECMQKFKEIDSRKGNRLGF